MIVPKAEELVAEAEKAEKEGNREKASELYLCVPPFVDDLACTDLSAAEPLQCIVSPDFQLPAQRSRGTHGRKARKLPPKVLGCESGQRRR